ncbi:MAG: TolC family outer membrane protein [Alphaproteobacteria bacterium]
MKQLLRLLCVPIISLCFINPAQAEYVTLEQALTYAYQNNPSLEAERAKLRATDEGVAVALSHWRPSIDATSSVGKTYQRIPSQQFVDSANFGADTTSYGVQVTQPIFRGFRTVFETDAAKKQVMAGRAQLEDAEQKLMLDTATAFLDIIRDTENLSLEDAYETVLHKKLEETKVRAQVGDLTQTDVQQSESRIARAEVTRLQTENTLQADRDAFIRLVGMEPASLAKAHVVLDKPDNLDEILHIAETRNPGVIAAQYALDQADAQIELNKGSLMPEVNLVAGSSRNYGQSAITPGREDQSQVELQLKIPLYDAGTDYAHVREARQTSVQRRMELEEARHHAHESARNAWQTLLTTSAAIKADRLEIEAASHALEGVKADSDVGTRTILDVLNAEQELLDAKTDLAKSDHDRNIAVLQIKSAIGELTAETWHLPLTPYNPEKHYDDNHAKWIGFGNGDEDMYIKEHKDDSVQNN